MRERGEDFFDFAIGPRFCSNNETETKLFPLPPLSEEGRDASYSYSSSAVQNIGVKEREKKKKRQEEVFRYDGVCRKLRPLLLAPEKRPRRISLCVAECFRFASRYSSVSKGRVTQPPPPP